MGPRSTVRAAMLCLWAASWSACGRAEDNLEPDLDLPAWHQRAAGVPVGGTFRPASPLDKEGSQALASLGFVETASGDFERRADLLAHDLLQCSTSDELPGIDAVAVVSVFRPQLKQQYLYPTLRSLLTELPAPMVVNLMVGTGEQAYASTEALVRELGREAAARVHVIAAPEDVAALFAQTPTPTTLRAGWNYARTLRSYAGQQRLLVFEDDVVLSKNFAAHLRPWLLSAKLPEGATLFSRHCPSSRRAKTLKRSHLRLRAHAIRRGPDFPTIQAMLLTAPLAQSAGDYLAVRAGREAHDWMLGRVFAEQGKSLGIFSPSPVQHIGLSTTGLSDKDSLPISSCFADVLP